MAKGGSRNHKDVDPVERLRSQIDAGELTGDRLHEARAWVGAEVNRRETEQRRKRYGVQSAILFLIVIVILAGVPWVFKKLIAAFQ